MTWQGAKPPEKESKYFKKPDESVLAGLNFDQTEVLFRKLVSMAMLLWYKPLNFNWKPAHFKLPAGILFTFKFVVFLDARKLRQYEASVYGFG